MSEVQLTISKEIVTPIVEAKIKEAILAAMGGKESLIEGVVNGVLSKKVDSKGQISSYSSENKHTWLDVVVTQQIQKAVEEAVKEVIANQAGVIKEAVIKQLQSKKGASLAAQALVDSLNGSFKEKWYSSIKIDLMHSKNV